MNKKSMSFLHRSLAATALAFLFSTLNSPLSTAVAQSSAFTYQGFLSDQGAPANGAYDLQLNVFSVSSGGGALTGALAVNDVGVTNGLFTVTFDFGASVFDGNDRWLEIAIRPGVSTGAYTNVVPRQKITATPYAIRAGNFSGPVAASQITGTLASSNIGVGTITASNLAPGSVTAVQLAPDAVGFPQLAKPYQAGRIDSTNLSLGFLDYYFTTNFPLAFTGNPAVSFSVQQSTTSPLGAMPQAQLYGAKPTNFTVRLSLPNNPPQTISTGSTSNGMNKPISANSVLGFPAVAFMANTCEIVEIVTCVTNVNELAIIQCQLNGGTFEDCSKAYTLVICNGTGEFYATNCSGGLRFALAQDYTSTAWKTTTITTNIQVDYPSLAVSSGPLFHPMIAYFDTVATSLQFSFGDFDGSVWPTPTTVVNHADVGRFCSLRSINGNPAIAYYNATTADLEYIRATNSTGVFNAATRVTVNSTNDVGSFCSLATIAGRPAIACYHNPLLFGDVVYFRANDANGTSWGTRQSVATPSLGMVGTNRHIALAEVNGLPAVAFFDNSAGQVKYVRGANTNGTAWTTVTNFPATAGDIELKVINGVPALLYHQGSRLQYAVALDPDGNTWSSPTSLTIGNTTSAGSMFPNRTVPGVFYVNTGGSNQVLRFYSPYAQPFILNWVAVEP